MPTLRTARWEDLPAINEIYNHYVGTSTSTYQITPATAEEREQWFEQHGEIHPVIVLEELGEVVGWGSLNPFRPREAFRHTVENSVYLHPASIGKGLGSLVLQELLRRASQLGHHVIIAGIDAEQTPSIALHTKFGFCECGRLKHVGRKFGRWLDVVYMQKVLES